MSNGRISRTAGLVAWAVTVLAIGLLLFSCLLPQRLYIVWQPYRLAVAVSFFGRVFTFHSGVALAVVMAVGLAMQRYRLALIAGLAAVAALSPSFWSFRPKHASSSHGPTIRVMAMNLYVNNRDERGITAQVRAAGADVICLEEFTPFHRRVFDGLLGSSYPYRSLEPREDSHGLGIYSRLPFVESPEVRMDQFHLQIRTAVEIDGQPVSLYVVHPRSPTSIWGIMLNRLQTVDLLQQLRGEAQPVIVAGDFNFTETTANAAALRTAGLQSTHDIAGSGRGSTWPAWPRWAALLPGVRIDHIFLGPQLTCSRDGVGGYDGSDHLPIFANIALR